MIKKEPTLKSKSSIIVKLTGQAKTKPEETKKVTKATKAKSEKKKTKEAKPAVKEKKIKTASVVKALKTPKAPKVKKEVAPVATTAKTATKTTTKAKTTKKTKVTTTPTITAEVLAGFSFAPAVISTNQINIDYFIAKLRTIADLQDDTNYRLQVLTEELETLQTNLKNKGEN